MPMNPRTLRPSRGVPVFSEKGYTRLWCLTNKSSGNVSGVAESDTGSYAVKWWDGTTEVLDSGDPFSKAAGGGTRAFEVYPCVERQTSLLLHFDGNFTDSSPNGLTVTANGGAATSTAQSKWGGASAYFDGANDYISNASSNWQYWDQDDWTIELWLYPQLAEGYEPIVTANASLNLHGLNSDLYLNNASNGNGGIQAIGALQVGQWQHIAVVRHLGISTIYVDGTSVASGPVPYGDAATELHIGGSPTQSAYFNGYIDDLRIVRDAAIYTANFTPPTGPLEVLPYAVLPSGQFDGFDLSGNALKAVRSEGVALEHSDGYTQTVNPYNYVPPWTEGGIVSNNSLSSQALDKFYTDLDNGTGSLSVSGNPGVEADDPTIATAKGYTVFGSVPNSTALLMHFDGNFTDSSPNGLTVTANGGAATSTAQSRWGGGSAYFDGSERYLSASVGVDWSDDWTIEMWYYRIGGGQGAVDTIFGAGPLSFDGPPGGLHLYDAGGGSLSLDDAIDVKIYGVAIPTATWTHLAIVRNAGQVSVFVDGSVQASQALSFPYANQAIVIGGSPTGGFYSNSYIDDFRIVSGVPLYTANFTLPTGPLGVYP